MINIILATIAGFGTYMALDFIDSNWMNISLPGHASSDMIKYCCAFIIGASVFFRGD